ncbi:MAG: structural cement protein Gp24 [Vagococcus fluvialis]
MSIKETDIRKAGMLAYGLSTWNKYDYKYSEEAIVFGAGVMRGTDKENQCKNMLTAGQFLGVAAFKNVEISAARQYEAQETVEVITSGKVWVQVAAAVTAGDRAACGLTGKFAKTGTSSYDDIDGVFETSAQANGYAVLNLK